MDTRRWSFVLADEQQVFLSGLTAILTNYGHTVLAATTTYDELRAALSDARPDICLLDVGILGAQHVEDMANLVAASEATVLIVLTGNQDPDVLRDAIRAGAAGYIHKSRGIATLLGAVRRIMRGEIVIEGTFVRRPGGASRTHGDAQASELPDSARLTPRERECIALVATGCSTTAIATQLYVSETTVRSHIQSAMEKLGVHSRLEAASLVNRYALLGPHGVGPPSEMRGRPYAS